MNYIEFSAKIEPLELGREILIAELAEIGFESFIETDTGITAYIQSPDFNIENIRSLNIINNKEFVINYTSQLIEEQNWNETWEKSFDPINVENRCYVRAPFHDKIDTIEFDVIIHPKMSFGTGHHETTYLMIKRLMTMDVENKKVLDMGCGTGVLAILAKMKNAQHVMAIDVDEWAYNNTIENITINKCEQVNVKLGGAELLNGLKFDLILANINRNILLNDMLAYSTALEKGGNVLFSGFFSSDKDVLINEASQLGWKMLHIENKNDWTLIHFTKE